MTLRGWLILSFLALLAACGGSRHALPPLYGGRRAPMATATASYASAVLADAPTQYFELNESTGPTAVDSSATAANGTYIGPVTFGVSGPLVDEPSTAISLPGGSSSVGVSVPNPNAASGTSYSIMTWVYPMPSSDYTTIWGYNASHRLLLSKTGQLLSQFSGNFFSKSALTTGAWHQVTFVYDAPSATEAYYVDGVLDSSASLANGSASFTAAYYLGQYNTAAYYKWNGRVGQHAFFRASLSAAQIMSLYNAAGYGAGASPTPAPSASPTPGTYGGTVLSDNATQYFKLNETSGPAALDSSTTAINGTYVGNVAFGALGPLLSEASTAISLSGGTSSAGVSLPNPGALSGTSYSIETWVYALPGSSYMTIWGYNGTHRLLLNGSGALLSQFNGGFTSNAALTFGQWHDVVFVYNAQTATETYYIDGAADKSAPLSNAAAAFTSPYYLGQYDTSTYYKWNGKLGQHAFFRSALTAAQVANLYAAAGYGATATPTPSPVIPAYSDWPTFGDGLSRSNYNASETTLSASNVSALHLLWTANLGAVIDAEPLVATNVPVNGTPATVLYVGAENGMFFALDANTGRTIWSAQLGAVTLGCADLPGGKFGITGTATFDKNANRIYVADGKNDVHALDMQTGAELPGWPVNIDNQFTLNHIYSALTLNPANGLLYAATGSFCDHSTWNGHITAIDTASASVVAQFFPGTPYNGAGIWGMGGAAVDSANDVYIGTGNTENAPADTSAYGDHLVSLDANLNVLGADTGTISGSDVDYGATPMVYQPPGCPQLVSIKGKAGVFPVWNAGAVSSGALQSLAMAPDTSVGQFIGVTAYSPVTNLVYVGDPVGNSTFTHGLVALAPQSTCALSLAWQQTVGVASSAGENDNDSPVVANGVVYFADGTNKTLYAFDATSGQMLWNSGGIIAGPVMAAPTVDGRVFVGSWDTNLYAFGL